MGTQREKASWELVAEEWGALCAERRNDLGLTQVAVAERIGMAQSVVSDVERGRYRSLTPELAIRFAVALDIEPRRIFTWPQSMLAVARTNVEGRAA